MVEGGHPRRLWTAAGAMLLVSAAYYGAHSVLTRAAYEAGGDVGFGSPVFQSIRFMWLLALLIVPVAGLVADKWLGIRRMLLLGSATVAVGIVLCIVKQVPFLMAGGAVLALGMGCFRYPLYVYLGEAYPKLAPTRLAGFVVLFIAGELGPMAVNLVSGIIISSFGTAFGFVFVALPAIAAFVLLLAVPEPPPAEASGPTLPSVFGPELVALAILAGIALCLDIAFAGALAGAHPRLGSSSVSTATMLALVYSVGPVVVLIAGVIVAVFWSGGTLSSYSEHVGTSLAIGGALIAMSVVLSTVLPHGEEGIGMGAAMGTHALTALGELAIYPMLMAAVTALAPQPWRATAVGVFALTGIGNFLPNLFPSSDASRRWLGFALLAVCGVAGAVALALRSRVESALELSAQDMTPVAIDAVRAPTAAPAASRGTGDLIAGGISLTLGLIITVGSLATSSATGGYVITTGLIIFGIVRLIRGFQKLGS